MNRKLLFRSAILGLVLAAGCGGGGDDAVIADQINLMNEMAAGYEKVSDADSWKAAQGNVEKLQQRAEELKRKESSWSEEKKQQLGRKFAGELKTASERLTKARAAALKKAGGVGPGPT